MRANGDWNRARRGVSGGVNACRRAVRQFLENLGLGSVSASADWKCLIRPVRFDPRRTQNPPGIPAGAPVVFLLQTELQRNPGACPSGSYVPACQKIEQQRRASDVGAGTSAAGAESQKLIHHPGAPELQTSVRGSLRGACVRSVLATGR